MFLSLCGHTTIVMRFCRGWSLEDMILSEAASSTGRFHSRTTGGNASSLLYSQVLKSTNHLHALYWIYMSVCVCVCYREQRTQPVHLLWILRASVLVQSHHELLTETHEEKKHPTLTPDWRFDVRDVWCVIFRFYATNFTLTLRRSSQVIMLNLKLLRFFSLFSRMCRNYLIIIWLKVQPVIQISLHQPLWPHLRPVQPDPKVATPGCCCCPHRVSGGFTKDLRLLQISPPASVSEEL